MLVERQRGNTVGRTISMEYFMCTPYTIRSTKNATWTLKERNAQRLRRATTANACTHNSLLPIQLMLVAFFRIHMHRKIRRRCLCRRRFCRNVEFSISSSGAAKRQKHRSVHRCCVNLDARGRNKIKTRSDQTTGSMRYEATQLHANVYITG